MKRVLSWLCLIIALAALPITAHAEPLTPGNLYLSYRIDGGTWHYANQMQKSETTWTYTLPETADSYVEFAINTIEASSESGLLTSKTQYCHGDNGKGTVEVGSATTLYLYENSDHWLKYNKAGKHTFTLNTTDGVSDATGYVNLSLDITTDGGGPVIPDYRDQVNLPIKKNEFGDKPRYFLVGTRMGDWRLQPEWELKDLGNGKVGIDNPRIMYTGRIAVAKVDNWEDYSVSKYTLFAYNQWGFCTSITSAQIYNKGSFSYYDNNAKVPVDKCDKFCAATDTKWSEDAVRYNKGALVDRIEVTLSNGNPVQLDFTFSANPFTDVNKYLTFSLVGSNIVNEGMPDAKNTHKGMDSWQCAWVQFDPQTGMPYRDANKQLYYQTVFQTDWLDAHPTVFNKKLSSRDFNYSSNQIVMRNVKSFTPEELAQDDYAEYYTRFDGSNKLLGKDGNNNQNVKIGDKYDFYEYMKFHNGANSVEYGSRTADWECYVVKDMWMDGTFKVWTGWGGGLKTNEISTTDNTDPRWYYVNGGHAHEYCKGGDDHAVVRGFDISRTGESVAVYGTAQDVNEADFKINNLTYFKRVIVWYDPAKGFENSVIQFIVERFGPAIKAVRGTMGNEIDYTWNIPDDPDAPFSADEKKTQITHYIITRYHLAEDNLTWISDGVVKEEYPSGLTVGDMITGVTVTESGLGGGTYKYRVDVWTRDGAGQETPRFAMSNRVTLYEASQPMTAVASQRTETEDNRTLYSFDMDLSIKLKNGTVTDGNANVYSYADLAKGYLIHVDEANATKANSALAFKVLTKDGETKELTEKFVKAGSKEVYSYSEATSSTEKITVTNGYWLTLDFDTYTSDFTLRLENLLLNNDRNIKFTVYLDPKDDLEVDYAQFNLAQAAPSATMYVPQLTAVWTETGVRKVYAECVDDSEATEGEVMWYLAHRATTFQREMPLGTHFMKDDVEANPLPRPHAPVHYREFNVAYAKIEYTAPAVTASVFDNYTLSYSIPDMTAVMEGTAYGRFTAEEKSQDLTLSQLDVTSLRNTEPLMDGAKLDGFDYYAPLTTGLPLSTTTAIAYQRDKSASYSTKFSSTEDDVTAETVLDLGQMLAPSAQEFSDIRISTVEEDDRKENPTQRYYVQDFHGIISFGENPTSLAYVPGFYLRAVDEDGKVVERPVIDNGWGSTDTKMAKGGIVATKGINDDFFGDALFDDYKEWSAPDPEDYFWEYYDDSDAENLGWIRDLWNTYEDCNNWAHIARQKNCLMPLFLRYFSVKPKTEAKTLAATSGDEPWRTVPNIGGYLTYHYPFLYGTMDAEGAPLFSMTTFTAATPINQAIDSRYIMTAIESVEADADLSDAEFFNLQGIRVMNPVPGQVYLIRRGAEVTKVLYK